MTFEIYIYNHTYIHTSPSCLRLYSSDQLLKTKWLLDGINPVAAQLLCGRSWLALWHVDEAARTHEVIKPQGCPALPTCLSEGAHLLSHPNRCSSTWLSNHSTWEPQCYLFPTQRSSLPQNLEPSLSCLVVWSLLLWSIFPLVRTQRKRQMPERKNLACGK